MHSKNSTAALAALWFALAVGCGDTASPDGTAGVAAGTFGTAGSFGDTAGTVGGTAGTFGDTAGTVGGTAGTFGDTAGTVGGTAGTGLSTAGTGGGTAGTGEAGTGGDGTFPHTDAVNVDLAGPYTVEQYAVTDPDWSSATMYYPKDAPEPFAAMAVSPGFTENKEVMTWWAEMLASHGFVVLNTSPFNTGTDQPQDRGKDLETAVKFLKAENAKAGSPLLGKIAVDRIALSGHSMGGGGTLHAAAALTTQVRAAIPLMEHGPAITATHLKAITANVLFIAGELDGEPLGPPTKYSIPHCEGMTTSLKRAVGVIKGGDHFLGINGGAHHEDIARYSVAWLKIHLEDDTRYEKYIYGADHTPTVYSTWKALP